MFVVDALPVMIVLEERQLVLQESTVTVTRKRHILICHASPAKQGTAALEVPTKQHVDRENTNLLRFSLPAWRALEASMHKIQVKRLAQTASQVTSVLKGP